MNCCIFEAHFLKKGPNLGDRSLLAFNWEELKDHSDLELGKRVELLVYFCRQSEESEVSSNGSFFFSLDIDDFDFFNGLSSSSDEEEFST